MSPDTSVVLVSRGDDMSVALTSLIAQDSVHPLVCMLRWLPNERDTFLLDTLRALGWRVSIHLQQEPGVGQARYEAARYVSTPFLVSLDDDAVLKPSNALSTLVDAARNYSFAMPIIRYVHNFRSSGIPDHEEIWGTVSPSDPRVQKSLAAHGEGWGRVYDFGVDQKTNDLGGTAFAVRSELYAEAVEGLRGWVAGGEDWYLGTKLCGYGPGVVLSGVYAYHVGEFSLGEWGVDRVGFSLARKNPEEFRKHAIAVSGVK